MRAHADNSARRGLLTLNRPRHRKGAMLLWFVLVQIPVMFFVLGMTVDFTRLYVAHRQAVNLAQAAAQAGSQQIALNSTSLNQSAAVAAADGTWTFANTVNAAPLLNSGANMGVTATQQTVTVTITYTVKGLIGFGVFPTSKTTVTASAFVCLPGQSTGPTSGYCATPGA